MNKLIAILILFAICSGQTLAQSRTGIGTTTPIGKLHISGVNGEPALVVESNFTPPQVYNQPLLKLRQNGADVLWLNADVNTNILMGLSTGSSLLPTAQSNMFLGHLSGNKNTDGGLNIGLGQGSIANSTSGDNNIAIGFYSLSGGTSSFNNVAVGNYAMSASGGSDNVSVGFSARRLGTGSYNTAVGTNALYNTTDAQYNTALGYRAGTSYNNGFNNVFVGANTDVTAAGRFNVIAIGQATVVNANSTARFGNSATTSYGGYAGWTNISDGRFKRNIREDVPGLSFITQLKPVTYNIAAAELDAFLHPHNKNEMDAAAKAFYAKALQEKENIKYSGFIAQDVEASAKALGFDFSGVDKPKTADDTYGLRYAEFVVPLVKAVQEQQEMIRQLQKEIEELKITMKDKR